MRNLVILILGVAVVWLLVERDKLSTQLQTTKSELTAAQSNQARGGQHHFGMQSQGGSWLDSHIERGAKILDNPRAGKPNRR